MCSLSKAARGQRRVPETLGGAPASEDSIAVQVEGPFDLPLSLAAAASFFPIVGPAPAVLVSPVFVDGSAAAVTIWQPSPLSSLVRASASPPLSAPRLGGMAKWLISAGLDLRPFYGLAAPHPILGPVAACLYGLNRSARRRFRNGNHCDHGAAALSGRGFSYPVAASEAFRNRDRRLAGISLT